MKDSCSSNAHISKRTAKELEGLFFFRFISELQISAGILMQQRSERTETHNEAPTSMSDSKATQQREGFPFCTHKQLLMNTKQPSSCWSLPLSEKLKTSPWL